MGKMFRLMSLLLAMSMLCGLSAGFAGAEEVIESPAIGHCFMWMDQKRPNGVTMSQYVCTVCGSVAEQRVKTTEQMYYNNTITSFGPSIRDLIGGGVWNRVTPLNLAEEGMFTYPLIASNLYTV